MMEALTVPRCPDVVLSDFGAFFEEQRRRREASPVSEAQPDAALSDEDARRVALLRGIAAEVLEAASRSWHPTACWWSAGRPCAGGPISSRPTPSSC